MFISPSGVGGSLYPHIVCPAVAAGMILPRDFLLLSAAENVTQAVRAGHMDLLNSGCKGFLIEFLKAQYIGSRLQQNAFRDLLAGAILSPLHIVGSACKSGL